MLARPDGAGSSRKWSETTGKVFLACSENKRIPIPVSLPGIQADMPSRCLKWNRFESASLLLILAANNGGGADVGCVF
jgi:hypothetical protein